MIGCRDINATTGLLPVEQYEVPENPGSIVTSRQGTDFRELSWTNADEAVVFSTSSYDYRIESLRVDNGEFRPLLTSPDFLAYITPNADGTAIFFARQSSTSLARMVVRHSLTGDSAEEVLSVNTSGWNGGTNIGGLSFLLAPDGHQVAVVTRPDSLSVYDPASHQSRFVATGCKSLVAWAPDASEVLCMSPDVVQPFRTFTRISLSNGSRQPVSMAQEISDYPGIVRWDASGLRIISSGYNAVSVFDGNTSKVTVLLPAGDILTGPGIDPDHFAWSQDGRRVAFWTRQCVRNIGWTSCGGSQAVLTVADLASNTVRQVAIYHYSGLQTGAIAFSPDGTHLLHSLGPTLYIKPV